MCAANTPLCKTQRLPVGDRGGETFLGIPLNTRRGAQNGRCAPRRKSRRSLQDPNIRRQCPPIPGAVLVTSRQRPPTPTTPIPKPLETHQAPGTSGGHPEVAPDLDARSQGWQRDWTVHWTELLLCTRAVRGPPAFWRLAGIEPATYRLPNRCSDH